MTKLLMLSHSGFNSPGGCGWSPCGRLRTTSSYPGHRGRRQPWMTAHLEGTAGATRHTVPLPRRAPGLRISGRTAAETTRESAGLPAATDGGPAPVATLLPPATTVAPARRLVLHTLLPPATTVAPARRLVLHTLLPPATTVAPPRRLVLHTLLPPATTVALARRLVRFNQLPPAITAALVRHRI